MHTHMNESWRLKVAAAAITFAAASVEGVWVFVGRRVYICVCHIYTYTYIYKLICIHICIYIYIYTHTYE